MFSSSTSFRALTILTFSKHTFLHTTTMAAPPITTICSGDLTIDGRPTTISLQEWQAWGTDSPIPTQVDQIVNEMIESERENDAPLKFGGLGGKLKGDFKTEEDKKHRAKYRALDDSEQKLYFFSARQIACRLLGSRGYLCQRCWLPREDCMCSRVVTCSLWHRIRFWLYMHPKDFLRQNNTGKLLWQVFGIDAAKLCIFGIAEHEEIMWKAFMNSGRNNVWCLYPNKNAPTKSVEDSFAGYTSNSILSEPHLIDVGETLNFILLDGTWSNSAAMFRRLQERSLLYASMTWQYTWSSNVAFGQLGNRLSQERGRAVWGVDLPSISLTTGASAMHKLRPQPSWDRTCTAAAAIGLLDELHLVSQFSSSGLDKQAEAVENIVDVLLASLTARRVRMGRSITRSQKHYEDFC